MFEQLTMDRLPEGQSGRVASVDADPHMRRRLLDLGLVPGARVTCQGRSPAGDPAAYRLWGGGVWRRAPDAARGGLVRPPGPEEA